MVKLAEKERDGLEVEYPYILKTIFEYKNKTIFEYKNNNFYMYTYQDVKNEAEAYMLKELSHLKWREKASKLAHEDTTKRVTELQDEVSTLEANQKTERFFLYLYLL